MSVSIWEGNKAQELIDAVSQPQKVDKQQGTANAGKSLVVGTDGIVVPGDADIANDVKVALLACLQNVAWVNENGQSCYNALYTALYGIAPPTPPTPEYEHTLTYNASSGVLLSSLSDIGVFVPSGQESLSGRSEAISDGALRIQVNDPSSWYQFFVNNSYMDRRNTVATKAMALAKVKFASMPITSDAGGLTFGCMDSTGKKASIISSNKNNVYSLGVRDANNEFISKKTISLNTFYTLETKIENGVQVITIDNEEVYTGDGHTYDGSNGFLCARPTSSASVDIYIESFVFQWT